MKKILGCLLLGILILSGCSGNQEVDYLDEPNFTGEVVEVHEESILVEVDEGEEERKSRDGGKLPGTDRQRLCDYSPGTVE